MDVDELVFQALAPLVAQTLVDRLEPLPKPFGSGLYGFGLDVVSTIAFLIVSVGLLTHLVMTPRWNSVIEIHQELCLNGFTEFVAARGPVGIPVFADTLPYMENPPITDASQKAVAQIIKNNDVHHAFAMRIRDKHGFRAAVDQNDEDFIRQIEQEFPACQDWMENATWAPELVRLQTGALDARTCTEMRLHCTREGQRLLRIVCASTCGCDSPTSGLPAPLFYDDFSFPCLPNCGPLRQEALADLTCRDAAIQVLISPHNTSGFMKLLRNIVGDSEVRKLYVDAAAAGGCAGVFIAARDHGQFFCQSGGAVFCPETCNCKLPGHLYCPADVRPGGCDQSGSSSQ